MPTCRVGIGKSYKNLNLKIINSIFLLRFRNFILPITLVLRTSILYLFQLKSAP